MGSPTLIELPRGTDMAASGPVFRYGAQKLTVDYDEEEVGGRIVWTRLEFRGVNAVKYTEEGQCDVDDLGEFHHISCWDSSPWLNEMVARWKSNYSQVDADADPGWLHYHLFCDHAGSLHVIARAVKIIENPELDALNNLPPCR